MNEITAILVQLFVIFAAAKVAGELFLRLRQPAIVGEVLVGVVIGPHALGLIGSPDSDLTALFGGDREAAKEALNVVFDVIAELGVIILLFFVGLQTRLDELLEVRNRALGAGGDCDREGCGRSAQPPQGFVACIADLRILGT